jgi:hypothetical protein
VCHFIRFVIQYTCNANINNLTRNAERCNTHRRRNTRLGAYRGTHDRANSSQDAVNSERRVRCTYVLNGANPAHGATTATVRERSTRRPDRTMTKPMKQMRKPSASGAHGNLEMPATLTVTAHEHSASTQCGERRMRLKQKIGQCESRSESRNNARHDEAQASRDDTNE